MQKIVFNDLEAQYAHLKKEIDAGIASVIEGCHFISGPQVEELEKALCAYTGRKYCVTVSSGTDALLMPLMALGIGKGDAVMLILKRRYEFWFSILALHKLGAVVIPALFVPPAFLCHGREAGLLALILALIMLSRHIRGLGRILRGEEARKFRRR